MGGRGFASPLLNLEAMPWSTREGDDQGVDVYTDAGDGVPVPPRGIPSGEVGPRVGARKIGAQFAAVMPRSVVRSHLEDVHVVQRYRGVAGGEGQILCDRLRHQHAVEWITVMRGRRPGPS